jgi:hypothetical protein
VIAQQHPRHSAEGLHHQQSAPPEERLPKREAEDRLGGGFPPGLGPVAPSIASGAAAPIAREKGEVAGEPAVGVCTCVYVVVCVYVLMCVMCVCVCV